jgi:MraZ protein
MINLIGQYEVRIDEKGRIKLPSKLIDQLGELSKESFIIHRGFDKNLAIYPKTIWEQKTKEINQFNIFERKQRNLFRQFYLGATELIMDNACRVNIPNNLLRNVGILTQDIMLFAYKDIIEIWALDEFNKLIEENQGDTFGEIYEEVEKIRSTSEKNFNYGPPSSSNLG